MKRTAEQAPSRWSLRHAWRSEADLAALALCREQLAGASIALVNAGPGETADAVKMHGMEIVGALAADDRMLHDLSGVAVECAWQERLPAFVRRFMVHGERWHGTPMGVHRANAAWVNGGIAQEIGLQAPTHPRALVAWLEEANRSVKAPLALGAEPWQIGVLFEALVLGVAGPGAYRLAFEQQRIGAWHGPALVEAVDCLMSLRDFVDDDTLGLGWSSQLDRVRRGEAALQVMGDWARATGTCGLLEWPAPGTAAHFVAVVDFFVPMAGGSHAVAGRAAAALTEAAFQRKYSQCKGCMPAMKEAWDEVDTQRAGLLAAAGGVLPSMTFDQCCMVPAKQALLETVARHFVDRCGTDACVRALADLTH